MEIYTRDRKFIKKDEIDVFESAIWSERYYGDGDFELQVPATPDMMTKLPKGQIMGCVDSNQPMILETRDIKDDILKATGITLTQWLNNRIIRSSRDHAVKEWLLTGHSPGVSLQEIVRVFCIASDYLDGTIDIGIPTSQTALFKVPGLALGSAYSVGSAVDFSVPFGPVYDALRQIAIVYSIGMRIDFIDASEDHFTINFITYKGADRTSDQTVNPVIRFSPEMDTFTNIRDLDSIADLKNWIYMYAPNAPPELTTNAGYAESATPDIIAPSFDLRVFHGFADDITVETLGGGADASTLTNVLNHKASFEAFNHNAIKLVDGEIVQTGQIKYGRDYFLGDMVEVEGNTGIRQSARITEYIRSQDSAGEREYPTLAIS